MSCKAVTIPFKLYKIKANQSIFRPYKYLQHVEVKPEVFSPFEFADK